MSIHMNLQPNEKWETVSMHHRGPGEGSCILIELKDHTGERYEIAIHYGFEYMDAETIAMFKKAVKELPDLQRKEKPEEHTRLTERVQELEHENKHLIERLEMRDEEVKERIEKAEKGVKKDGN